jgi:carbon-monoxide dehydrogenase small subunit
MADAPVVQVQFVINGRHTSVTTHPLSRLLDVLRLDLHLTGTKEGCGEGECGACSVLVNGQLVNSCLTPVLQVDGAAITTIEGVADREGANASEPAGAERGSSANSERGTGGTNSSGLHEVQQAFIRHGGAQCGICTPGMVLAAISLLERYPNPTEAQVRSGLAGNLCRCTGYMRIFQAVREASRPQAPGPRPQTDPSDVLPEARGQRPGA